MIIIKISLIHQKDEMGFRAIERHNDDGGKAPMKRRLFYLILLVLTLTAPAFAAHEQGR